MPRKLTLEYVKDKTKEIAIGYECLAEEYRNRMTKLNFICDKGHVFRMPWDSFFSREYRCPLCAIEKRRNPSIATRMKLVAINKGKKFSLETRKKISMAHKGKTIKEMGHKLNCTCTVCKRLSGKNHPMYGKHHTEETRAKMSINRKGKCCGKESPHFGKNRSLESRAKQSTSRKGKLCGEKNPNWKGGISTEPYCWAWNNKEYKDSIKQRDNYQCQNPECWGKSNNLTIHHIDYIKKNCQPLNLVTLCASCNSRANFNREYWIDIYTRVKTARSSHA